MKSYLYPILMSLLILASCAKSDQGQNQVFEEEEINQPAVGFNLEGSDPEAIELADEVMLAMGGRKNWDKTRVICWNFFGARELIWDKWTGDVRIESERDSMTYLVNINTMEGKVAKDGVEITDQEEVNALLDRAKQIWINDSYWLVMPFKLKDSGVTLKYMGEDTTMTGAAADVIQLTFENVGVTPQNKYEIWIDKKNHLVKQWYYYPTDSSEARIKGPWGEYEKHGDILLSGDRGERDLTNIMVFEEVPEEVFESLEPVKLESL